MAQRNDISVKIASDVARDAKIVAAFRQISLAQYLSETLRACVDQDLRRELVERSNEHEKLGTSGTSSVAGQWVGVGHEDA